MVTTIIVNCVDQVLSVTNSPQIASGGINEDQVVFTFCEQWTGFSKTAVFYRDEETVYNVVLDETNTAIVPSEVLQTDGEFFFGVFGIKDNVTRTSEVLRYKVKQGALLTGERPIEPTPDIYQQIMTQYGEIITSYNEMLDDFANLPYVHKVDGESITPVAPIINDSTPSGSTTYSSTKIESKFSNTVDDITTGEELVTMYGTSDNGVFANDVTGTVTFKKYGNIVICNIDIAWVSKTGSKNQSFSPLMIGLADFPEGLEPAGSRLQYGSVGVYQAAATPNLDTNYGSGIVELSDTGMSINHFGQSIPAETPLYFKGSVIYSII